VWFVTGPWPATSSIAGTKGQCHGVDVLGRTRGKQQLEMSSIPSKKRAASPADNTMTSKRLRAGTPSELDDQVANIKQPDNASGGMQDAVKDFFSEVSYTVTRQQQSLISAQYYSVNQGNVSPRLPSEMDEE
jgi:hypothetical protein